MSEVSGDQNIPTSLSSEEASIPQRVPALDQGVRVKQYEMYVRSLREKHTGEGIPLREKNVQFLGEAELGLSILSGWQKKVASLWKEDLSAANITIIEEGAQEMGKVSGILLDRLRKIHGKNTSEDDVSGLTDREEVTTLAQIAAKYRDEPTMQTQYRDLEKMSDEDIANEVAKYASTSHDLRTPLTSVSGFAQLAQRYIASGRVVTPMLSNGMKTGIDTIGNMIEDLTEPDRSELSSTAIAEKIREVSEADYLRKIGITGLDVVIDFSSLPEEALPLIASNRWIKALSRNIQTNTIGRGYANRPQSRADETVKDIATMQDVVTDGKLIVTAKLSPNGQSVIWNFSDFGAGYPPKRVLEQFQMGETDNADKKGLGIGMSAVVTEAENLFSDDEVKTTVTAMNVLRNEDGKITYTITREEKDGEMVLVKRNMLVPGEAPQVITAEQADVSGIPYAGAMTEVVTPIQTLAQFEERKSANTTKMPTAA